MLVLLVCCLIVNHALRVNSVVFKDELPISGTANIKNLKQYIDSKIKEDILQTQGVQCSAGWLKYGGHCYLFSRSRIRWATAQSYCKRRGANLVKIDNAAETAWIVSKRGMVRRAWIGLYDLTKTHKWRWVSDKSLLTSKNWAPGEPNNRGEACAEMFLATSGGKWNDIKCSILQHFICEKS